MVGQARAFSRVTLGVGAALTLGFASLVAPAAADEGDSNASCDAKGWEAVAKELLGDAEPQLCDEAEDKLGLMSTSGDDGEDTAATDEDADESDLAVEDLTAATQAVGEGRNGETVILVASNDAEVADVLTTAYPNATVKSIGGELSALADINGDVVGGAGIYSLSGGNQVSVCSIGFPAWSPDGEPAAVTAGHCTDDGGLVNVGLSDPASDGPGDDSFAPADDFGTYGFSQFGGPGNEPVDPKNPSVDDVTDIAVIDVTNDELSLVPQVTDWSNLDDLSSSTTLITNVGDVQTSGADIQRSGRTTGHATAPASNVEISEGVAQVEDRLVRGFWIEGLEAAPGDSGGPVYQGQTAIGLVSGGSSAGVWAADLQDALSYTGGYTVQRHLDAPELGSPEDGGRVAAGGTISGTAPAGSTLVVTPDAGEAFEVEVDSAGDWSFSAPEDEFGEYAFNLKAKDGFNESEQVEYAVEVTIPAPAFSSPEDGDVVTEPISEVTGTGIDGATVTLEVNGEVVDSETVIDGEWTIETDLGYGEYTLSASQASAGEESAAVEADVTVAPAAPEITSPEDGASFDVGEAPAVVEGTGLDGATVTLEVDGEEIGTAEVSNGQWSIELAEELDAGDYELTATQSLEGVSSAAATVAFSVNEVAEDGDPEDEDPGSGSGGDDSDEDALATLPETGFDGGVAPALISAALLVMAGIGTRIWKRVVA